MREEITPVHFGEDKHCDLRTSDAPRIALVAFARSENFIPPNTSDEIELILQYQPGEYHEHEVE